MLDNPLCVFEWRYGSPEMKRLFTISNIVATYIKVESALMDALAEAGLAPPGCKGALERCSSLIAPTEVYELEGKLGHDIAALAQLLGERCGECGKYVHLGATSYDVVDTAWALILREALGIVKSKLKRIIEVLSYLASKYADAVMPGRTHGQHAIPITFGFKFANYAYELARSYERLSELEKRVVKLKMSGAVGTMAAWGEKGIVVEHVVSRILGLEPHPISTQVAPRDGLAELVAVLAVLASQLDRFALEVRELSRPEIGEMYEVSQRVGSSTMPHKRNPVTAERISGLARVLRGLAVTALENVPLMHERDLTNSSSERVLLPHAFLTIDQVLEDALRLLSNLHVDVDAARRNIEITRGAVYSELLMVKLVERGWARHRAHEKISSLVKSMKPGRTLKEAVLEDPELSRLFSEDELDELMKPEKYLGCTRVLIERALGYAKRVLER